MKYTKGYKYQLKEDFEVDLLGDYKWMEDGGIHGQPRSITSKGGFLEARDMFSYGWNTTLKIKAGYAWDGPSGPTIDTKDFMIPSLVHDALYQLLRNGFIAPVGRIEADKELKRLCLSCGMPKWRSWYVYRAVRFGGRKGATERKEIFEV